MRSIAISCRSAAFAPPDSEIKRSQLSVYTSNIAGLARPCRGFFCQLVVFVSRKLLELYQSQKKASSTKGGASRPPFAGLFLTFGTIPRVCDSAKIEVENSNPEQIFFSTFAKSVGDLIAGSGGVF